MVMWKFKSCPRCGGDIFIGRDFLSRYQECLQCGYLSDMPDTTELYWHGQEKGQRNCVAIKVSDLS